ncbi:MULTISPECIES: hypothetical protein [Streptomyces]|uniref:hypothetical protein n=1 Tax=Streptomyces lycopersici TaxID=2974589 RepID=UPI00293E0311|nr:hypothetical protein [Streptomyces sp. NEAU-383]
MSVRLAAARDRQRRIPLPDECSTLDISDAPPIRHTARVTLGTDDRPLILEELRPSADRAQLGYCVTADRHLSAAGAEPRTAAARGSAAHARRTRCAAW